MYIHLQINKNLKKNTHISNRKKLFTLTSWHLACPLPVGLALAGSSPLEEESWITGIGGNTVQNGSTWKYNLSIGRSPQYWAKNSWRKKKTPDLWNNCQISDFIMYETQKLSDDLLYRLVIVVISMSNTKYIIGPYRGVHGS